TCCRGSRSAQTPPARKSSTWPRIRAKRTNPRSETEPVRSRTANAIATGTKKSPTVEISCAQKTRRKSRRRRTSGTIAASSYTAGLRNSRSARARLRGQDARARRHDDPVAVPGAARGQDADGGPASAGRGLDGAGFAYLEVSGGGVFDSAVRR